MLFSATNKSYHPTTGRKIDVFICPFIVWHLKILILKEKKRDKYDNKKHCFEFKEIRI